MATKIRSEEIVVVPDELCVYPKSYGNESELEIVFPVGAVETECRLNVQVSLQTFAQYFERVLKGRNGLSVGCCAQTFIKMRDKSLLILKLTG